MENDPLLTWDTVVSERAALHEIDECITAPVALWRHSICKCNPVRVLGIFIEATSGSYYAAKPGMWILTYTMKTSLPSSVVCVGRQVNSTTVALNFFHA